MEKLPNNVSEKPITGEIERIVEMSVTTGFIQKPTEKDKEEIIKSMYTILKDYASLNYDSVP